MFELFKKIVSAILPRPILEALLPLYHRALGWGAAVLNGFPAKKLVVIGITGTKGKSSTVEMVNAILEEAGLKTAVISTIRFKIDKNSHPNRFKMTMPGRGYIQGLLKEAVKSGCTHVVIEITSEGARQARNAGLYLDLLIFTNIAREHIESHGSFEKYKAVKISIGNTLLKSPKRPRTIVANPEDEVGGVLLRLPVENRVPFSLSDAEPYQTYERSASFTFGGTKCTVPFPGEFTILNALAAAKAAQTLGISPEKIARALKSMEQIPGRVECVERGQDFLAVVDYAHTPDSLEALYHAFPTRRKICVLGNTGGGRDHWKRPEMGAIADKACDVVILTNEDPYDEDPRAIVEAMARGMVKKPTIIMDRRAAIHEALRQAGPGDAVLISGKGTDPYIMEANGKKTPWSDAGVVSEELEKLLKN